VSAERAPAVFNFPDKGSKILCDFTARRARERAIAAGQALAMRDSGFAGAAINRLTMSMAQLSGAVNADLDSTLVILRSRARALCANNEWGRRFLSLVALNIVGPSGPTLQVRAKTTTGALDKPANDAVEVHFARWARTADVTGRMSLAHLLRVAAKGVARDGEALVRLVRNKKLPYGIALQLLEADRLDENLNARLANGNTIRQGVEIDSMLRPVAYHIFTSHPGESWNAGPRTTERVEAKDIYHLYVPERAEQVRGYSWLHAVLMRGAMLHGFEEAAVVAARVGAAKMGVFKRAADASDVGLNQVADAKDATTGALQMTAEPGEFVELPVGYELQSWDPEYPHANFESFLKACLRGLATGLDVATHNLSGDMTDVNYSSARIAELAEREVWTQLQTWLIESLLMPVFGDWLASALMRGDITFEQSGKSLPADRLEKFYNVARFQGRTWAWVDPLKEAQASAELVSLGLASRTELAAGRGREFDDVIDELKAETAAMAAAGLPTAPKAAKPAAEPPNAPAASKGWSHVVPLPNQQPGGRAPAWSDLIDGLCAAKMIGHATTDTTSLVAEVESRVESIKKDLECLPARILPAVLSVISASFDGLTKDALVMLSGLAAASAVEKQLSSDQIYSLVRQALADATSADGSKTSPAGDSGSSSSSERMAHAEAEPIGDAPVTAGPQESSRDERSSVATQPAADVPDGLPTTSLASDSGPSSSSNGRDHVTTEPSGDAPVTAGPRK